MANGEHAHHRARMRSRLEETGLGGFASHEIVELLLFHAIPLRDVNPIAHALIERFGTIDGVLSAPEEELAGVPGVGQRSAAFLKDIDALTEAYARSLRGRPGCIRTLQDAMFFAPAPSECKATMLTSLVLTGGNQPICSGTWPWRLPFSHRREILSQAVERGACAVVLIYSSPSDWFVPSRAERDELNSIVHALTLCEIRIVDVLFRTSLDYQSLRAGDMLADAEPEYFLHQFPDWFGAGSSLNPAQNGGKPCKNAY